MLEFIIALLMSLGLYSGDQSSITLDAKTVDLIKAEGKYEELGGDKAFGTLYQPNEDPEAHIVIGIDPNPQDHIVIGIDPNPEEQAQN